MKFREFIWPVNPSTTCMTIHREAEYSADGTGYEEFSGLSGAQRVLTGSGVFTGTTAIERFRALAELMSDGTAGALFHPVWGNMEAFLMELTLEQDARADLVRYNFTFREAVDGAIVD